MYDSLSLDYDNFVNWPERLAFELPFLEQLLSSFRASELPVRVLDAACGTGMHAVALAQRGYGTAGADLSAGMISKARANALKAGVQVDFQVAGFGGLGEKFRGFEALLCLGNSLPHILGKEELRSALLDFSVCLKPGGLLLIQNRNFDAVLAQHSRWMGPEARREADREWLFLRFYDFDPDGMITFNIITLFREGVSAWQQKIDSVRLYPLRAVELTEALKSAGFGQIQCFGNMQGEPFDLQSSGNLVISAIRSPNN
jgi:SAM-dependent methyltransferase